MPVKPLSFKGDKKSKKRKHQSTHDETDTRSSDIAPRAQPKDDEGDDTWVTAEVPTDLVGPVVLVLPSDTPTCLACDAHGKVFISELENLVEGDPNTAEPHDVRQVWVASRVAGSEQTNFKGHHGRYLSCDRFGILSARTEAISPEESFLCISSPDTPGTFSVQTVRETFLSIKETGGKGQDIEVRGDADSINFNTTLRIRMQARFKPRLKTSREEKAREKISRKELEEAVGRKLEDDEVKRLKRARREGNYHEEILDVRVKGKHDKFAS